MSEKDVICAIATAPGKGAVAIIRVSGSGCISLCNTLFVSVSGVKPMDARPNHLYYGKLHAGDQLVDEVMLVVFYAPNSFTGEESLEIHCHGSSYIQQQILQLLISSGCRLARPGEFTQRAFLNGKMDLSQAEAVADLIASTSAATHRMAMSQMRGGFSAELLRLRSQLLNLTSLLELELDFSEEDVTFADRGELMNLASETEQLITRLCNSFSLGNVLKNGVPVAIAGATNVGKSTLLNALLQEEKAIVSDIAGTTRDVIEDVITLNDITFRFIDTAGIRHTTDQIEQLGIERTFTQISRARIILLMVDGHQGIDDFPAYYRQIKEHLPEEATLFILVNKIDLVDQPETLLAQIRSYTSGEPILSLSAKKGLYLQELQEKLVSTINTDSISSGEVIVSNLRHYEALTHARNALLRAMEGLSTSLSSEFISQDIRECIHYLGEITGTITTDEVLGHIFSNFCIGK